MHPAAMPLITSAQSVSMIEHCPGRTARHDSMIHLDLRVDRNQQASSVMTNIHLCPFHTISPLRS